MSGATSITQVTGLLLKLGNINEGEVQTFITILHKTKPGCSGYTNMYTCAKTHKTVHQKGKEFVLL